MQETQAGGRTHAELAIRKRLLIPSHAQRVIIFGESSHWDPNWILTSEQYYRYRIRRIMRAAIAALSKEPRRVFSLECLFFLKLFWEREPAAREKVRELVNSRRLRLTGFGMTTPDTLLPSSEAILRDYLLGQEWLSENGMQVQPRLAYLPDDFGHSPELPALLAALGVEQAAVTRVDGMYFVGCDLRLAGAFPLRGSSAAQLSDELKTLDFRWLASDGSEVLCHWNAFTYFQGDMLAHRGIIRWMGLPLCIPWRTERYVARQINRFVDELSPVSRSPYLFCPIGLDFNGPIADLVSLLDRYNDKHVTRTGTYAVNAGLDDYLDLLAEHKHALPALKLDPNPYWMGFYASRPGLKKRCNQLACKLQVAETLLASIRYFPTGATLRSAARAPEESATKLAHELSQAWDLCVLSNHHDFITGTSPDRVVHEEQLPWLAQADALANRALDRLSCRCHPLALPAVDKNPRWQRRGSRLVVTTEHFELTLDEASGGCIVSLLVDGKERLRRPGNDLVGYRDSGGLWRMGHEYLGGSFREVERASARPATLSAEETGDGLHVTAVSTLCGRTMQRHLWIARQDPLLRFQVRGAAARRRTITCELAVQGTFRTLLMDVPGGVVERPVTKLYHPTFWSARTFAYGRDCEHNVGLAVCLTGPACVSSDGDGGLAWVVLRNAPRERAFRILPVLAHPASGSDPDEHIVDYCLWVTRGEGLRALGIPKVAQEWLESSLLKGPWDTACKVARQCFAVDHRDVLVSATKLASRGDGVIVRLFAFNRGEAETVRLRSGFLIPTAAELCDARERPLYPLSIDGHEILVPVERSVVTVRAWLDGQALGATSESGG